jgi:hypothetical protein
VLLKDEGVFSGVSVRFLPQPLFQFADANPHIFHGWAILAALVRFLHVGSGAISGFFSRLLKNCCDDFQRPVF